MASLWFVLVVQISIPQVISPPVIRATMCENRVYTSGVVDGGVKPDIKWTFGGGRLWLQAGDLKDRSEITSLDYMFGLSGRKDALLRWQLINGQYYCVNYSGGGGIAASAFRSGYIQVVPMAAIELVNAIPRNADFYSKGHHYTYGKLIKYEPHLSPVGKAVGWGEDSIQNRRIFFDFWCRGDKQYEVYVTEPHKGNRLTRGDFHAEWVRRNDYEKWDKVGEWTFDWTGPFYVAANGDDRYFVTDSGRVFIAPRESKAGTPLKVVWKGSRVEALIHDADAKKFYAFTKDQYFEVADPIVPKPHTIAIRREWTANKALETAVRCGRVIRGIPEPKDK